ARQLKELREQAGLTMRAVSEALGWSLTRYQHYEDRYKRRFLPFELARDLEAIFVPHGVESGAVLQLAGIEHGQPVSLRREPPPPVRVTTPASQGQRDLPVMGAVKGGSEGFYFNEGEAKEFVERPANLRGVSNGLALYVDGDSMEPRYFAGELLYVNPNRPLTKNCFVAVELTDGQGLIKQFLRRSDDEVVLRQFNPPKDIHLRAGEVRKIHRITGSAEGG
ncbi:MAG TPA: S24 family peptidase, partial [Dongiaceae bacterium]